MLIGVEGAKTPVGVAGQVRPRRSVSDEEAHRPPHGKRSAWNGNQQPSLTELKRRYLTHPDKNKQFSSEFTKALQIIKTGLTVKQYIFT
jgi:hypothetical protein